jgi:peroxiredoxin
MVKNRAPSGLAVAVVLLSVLWTATTVLAASAQFEGRIYGLGELKSVDSEAKLKVGDKAPDFSLPSLSGGPVSLSQFLGKKNVVISFVPAAWTPVCSEQWPGYNIAKSLFDANDAIILGITVDNAPTLYAWTQQMGGVWFSVLSDFWPHGEVAGKYGVLRSNGTSERAVFIVDKQGVIRYMDVHDINERPNLEGLVRELQKLKS